LELVLSQTRPGPPPGATVLEDADLLDDEDVAGAADELGVGLAAGVELEDDAAGVEALEVLGLAAALLEDVALELELAASQVSTPLWPLQAPDLVGEVV
jgi:hypothetical protein